MMNQTVPIAVFVPPTRRKAMRWSRTSRNSGPFSPTIPAGGLSAASGRAIGTFGSEAVAGGGDAGWATTGPPRWARCRAR